MICMDLSCPKKAAKAIVIDGRGKGVCGLCYRDWIRSEEFTAFPDVRG